MKIQKAIVIILLWSASHTVLGDTKINGVSFVASRDKAVPENVIPVVELNANFAAVMPFGFVRDLGSPEVRFNTDRQWYGETIEGAQQYIELLQKSDIKIMIKPQIWIWRGDYTGHLKMASEEHWRELEVSYRQFILAFAGLAEEVNAEIFCIGTELEMFIKERPEFWEKLIKDVKTRYTGKLTYAANWDEYPRVPFWQELDYIGVDAYFPIAEQKTPSVAEAKEGWQTWKTKLQSFSESNARPILFTEFGYRSIDHAGREPWQSDRTIIEANLQAQSNLTEALFSEFWRETWFAGGFVWKWFLDHKSSGGVNDNRFTPQNKPVEDVIRQQYLADE